MSVSELSANERQARSSNLSHGELLATRASCFQLLSAAFKESSKSLERKHLFFGLLEDEESSWSDARLRNGQVHVHRPAGKLRRVIVA